MIYYTKIYEIHNNDNILVYQICYFLYLSLNLNWKTSLKSNVYLLHSAKIRLISLSVTKYTNLYLLTNFKSIKKKNICTTKLVKVFFYKMLQDLFKILSFKHRCFIKFTDRGYIKNEIWKKYFKQTKEIKIIFKIKPLNIWSYFQ